MNLKNYCNIGFAQLFASSMSISDKLFFRSMLNQYGKIKMLSVFIILTIFTIPISANDFYPSNVSPATGDNYSLASTIPISFDICLGYNFPAAAGEWYVEITILDSNSNVVYFETLQGFDANGPACFPITDAPDFSPSADGRYSLQIQTFYAQEINAENDISTSEFVVKSIKDLAAIKFNSPQPMAEFFVGLNVEFKIVLRNNGEVPISKDDYSVIFGIKSDLDVEGGHFYTFYPNEEFDLQPGEEKEFTIVAELSSAFQESDFNKMLNYVVIASIAEDDNPENNTLIGNHITFIPNPIFPNEFYTTNGLNKIANDLADNDFVEFIVTDNFSDPELYNLIVYDSSGHQVDSTSLDLFTVGETVDSFTVYSYEFSGDVLPNHGAIALTYDSLIFSEYFISWGGPITAVEGLWKDSTSTDIGITPAAGSSISLSGHGTDFSAFTWENSTPTPGLINDSQLVPVEAQTKLAEQFSLEQNYPNPFNPSTRISYQLPKASEVTIKIFNTLGQEIHTLINTFENPGYKSVIWNGKDNNSNSVTSGIYFYEIVAGDFRAIRKAVLLK